MANPAVLTTFVNPDPNAAPLTVTQLVQLLNSLVSSTIQGTYIPYVISNDTPGADDHDKAWIVLDTNGRPTDIKIWYNGNWRRVYNGMLGEVRGYNGDPTVDFDTDGLGLVGGRYDGWHLCNGKDGTPDLSDKFLIGGHMNNSHGHTGYSSGWQTFVDGSTDQKTGGNHSVTLDAAHTYEPPIDVVVYKRSAPGDTSDPAGNLAGVTPEPATDVHLYNNSGGNTTPDPINILNPFVALGWIIFVGYST